MNWFQVMPGKEATEILNLKSLRKKTLICPGILFQPIKKNVSASVLKQAATPL